MLCLAYNAGLRVSELVGLALDDLQAPGLDRIRILGKGRRGRVLPLWKETRGALRTWLGVRPDSPDRHLFLNAFRTGLTRRGFAKRLALHAKAAARAVPSIAGKAITPHALRHACAKDRKGRFGLGRKPIRKRMNRTLKRIEIESGQRFYAGGPSCGPNPVSYTHGRTGDLPSTTEGRSRMV